MKPILRQLAPLISAGLLATAVAGCGGDDTQSTAAASDGVPSTLRMAVTDLQGLEELQREFGAFTNELEKATGSKIELYPVSDRSAAAAALAGDKVDLVFTGPAEYVVLRSRAKVDPVIAIRRPGYRSCIYVDKDSPAQSLADLKGKTVGMSDIGSTSGHLGPSQLFVDAGMNPQEDLKVATVGDAVHAALERGDLDAVGVGCHDRDEYIEGKEAEYRTLKEGPPLPPDVIVSAPTVSAAARKEIHDAFQANWQVLLPAMLEGKDNAKYEDAELVSLNDQDYDVVRSMYTAIGIENTEEFVGE